MNSELQRRSAKTATRRPRARRRGPTDGRAGRRTAEPVRFTSWLPALLALGLFTQICLKGLQPAVREEARLDAVAEELEARQEQLLTEAHELEQRRAALRDPVYRERLRRDALNPGTFDSAAR